MRNPLPPDCRVAPAVPHQLNTLIRWRRTGSNPGEVGPTDFASRRAFEPVVSHRGFSRGTLGLRNTRSSRTIQDWKVTASSGGGFPSISTCQPPETRPRSKLTRVNTLKRPTKFGLGRDNRVRHQGAKLPRHRRSYAAIWWERISHASNSDLLASSNPNLELKP